MTSHAQERAEQRYNTHLSKRDKRSILSLINEGSCYNLEYPYTHYKDRRTCYVLFNHIPLKIIYAFNRKNKAVALVTILPFDVDEYNEIIEKGND